MLTSSAAGAAKIGAYLYRDHFAFEVEVLWPRDHPTFAILRREGSGLGFFEPDEHRGPGGYAELYIEVDDAAGLHEHPPTTHEPSA